MKLQQTMGVIACTLGAFVGGVLFPQQASADDAAELAKKLQ